MPATAPRLVGGRTSVEASAPSAPAAAAAVDVLPSDLDALMSELGSSDATVSLWRVNDRGRSAYLRRMPAADFDLDAVRERNGGGTYEVRVIGPGERIKRQVRFAIDGAPKETEGAAGAGDASRLDRLEGLLAQVLERQAAPAPTGDPLTLALKIVEVMRPASTPAPAQPASEMFATLNAMLDLRERIAGDVDPAPPPSALERIAEPMMTLLGRSVDMTEQQMRRRAPRPAAPASPAPSPTTPETTAGAVAAAAVPGPAVPAAPADPLAPFVAQVPAIARAYLASCARTDKDPALYADVVLDALPDDVVQQLPALLAGDDAAARLCALVPQWAHYPRWFGELVEAIRAGLADDAGAEGAPE